MGLLGALGTGFGAWYGGSGGAAIGGAIGGGLDSVMAGNASNAMAADEAQRNREFQADMSSTAYQRAVADMKAAGLNPMLAYQQGGASSPSGSMASFTNAEASTGSTMGGYLSAGMASAQSDVLKSQAMSNLASAAQSEKAAQLAQVTADKVKEEIKNVPLEGDRLRRAAEALYQSANLDYQKQLTESEQWNVAKATARKLVADGTLSELDVKAARDMGNAGRELGQLKPFFDLLINAIRMGSRR